MQLVRSPLSEQFGIVVQASATELVAEAVEHVGAPHDAGMGVAFWQWHKSGCTFRLAPGDAEHWVLLPPHAGAAHEGWYAVGNTWCEVGMGGRAEVPAVFAHVAGLQAATAAAASDMAVTAAAQAASAAAAVDLSQLNDDVSYCVFEIPLFECADRRWRIALIQEYERDQLA